MYKFYSLGETPASSKDHRITIMTGIKPYKDDMDFEKFDPEDHIFDFFLFERGARTGMYIENARLPKVIWFLKYASQNPEEISKMLVEFNKSGLGQKGVTLNEIAYELTRCSGVYNDSKEFLFLPSFEPFILPAYVKNESEYRLRQFHSRIAPYRKLRDALQVKDIDKAEVDRSWATRNGPFFRLSRPIKGISDRSYFDPLYYCPEAKHYWEWLEVGEGNNERIYNRSACIISDDPNRRYVLPIDEGPPEYREIPYQTCYYHHNYREVRENGFIKRNIFVTNKKGMHVRPSTEIAMYASRYDGEVQIRVKDKTVDCKDLLSLLTLEAQKNTELTIIFKDINDKDKLEHVYRGIFHAVTNECT